jgi:hypothetical protein
MLFVISVALVERDHAGERAFDLADVGFDAAGGVGEANASCPGTPPSGIDLGADEAATTRSL